jgi:hypothetical protein
MDGIILPKLNFKSDNNPDYHSDDMSDDISNDQTYGVSDDMSDGKSDDQSNDLTDGKSDCKSDDQSDGKSDGKSNDLTDGKLNELSDKLSVDIPIYDGIEPYYMFERRLHKYIETKQNKHIHETILEFLNLIFKSEYKSLKSIKKISKDLIPSSKKFVNILKSDNLYVETFKIRYNQNIPTEKMINKLLEKISYRFVEKNNGKSIYYDVKPF